MKLSAHFLVKGQDYGKVYIFKDIVAANVSEVDSHVMLLVPDLELSPEIVLDPIQILCID